MYVASEHTLCRAGYNGKLHPVHLAGRFHSALQLWLAKRRGAACSARPTFKWSWAACPTPRHALNLLCTLAGHARVSWAQ